MPENDEDEEEPEMTLVAGVASSSNLRPRRRVTAAKAELKQEPLQAPRESLPVAVIAAAANAGAATAGTAAGKAKGKKVAKLQAWISLKVFFSKKKVSSTHNVHSILVSWKSEKLIEETANFLQVHW